MIVRSHLSLNLPVNSSTKLHCLFIRQPRFSIINIAFPQYKLYQIANRNTNYLLFHLYFLPPHYSMFIYPCVKEKPQIFGLHRKRFRASFHHISMLQIFLMSFQNYHSVHHTEQSEAESNLSLELLE